jgi:hypothetical protein
MQDTHDSKALTKSPCCNLLTARNAARSRQLGDMYCAFHCTLGLDGVLTCAEELQSRSDAKKVCQPLSWLTKQPQRQLTVERCCALAPQSRC